MSKVLKVQKNGEVQFINQEKYDDLFADMRSNIFTHFKRNVKPLETKKEKPCDGELQMLQRIQYKKLLNITEVCLYLGIGENSVRNILNKPKNPYTVKLGNRLYANKEMLDKWCNQCCGDYNGRSIL